ncbi:MAG: hypothetical protein ACFFD4_24710 [Candidatus Odinarchaeota archaeon]
MRGNLSLVLALLKESHYTVIRQKFFQLTFIIGLLSPAIVRALIEAFLQQEQEFSEVVERSGVVFFTSMVVLAALYVFLVSIVFFWKLFQELRKKVLISKLSKDFEPEYHVKRPIESLIHRIIKGDQRINRAEMEKFLPEWQKGIDTRKTIERPSNIIWIVGDSMVGKTEVCRSILLTLHEDLETKDDFFLIDVDKTDLMTGPVSLVEVLQKASQIIFQDIQYSKDTYRRNLREPKTPTRSFRSDNDLFLNFSIINEMLGKSKTVLVHFDGINEIEFRENRRLPELNRFLDLLEKLKKYNVFFLLSCRSSTFKHAFSQPGQQYIRTKYHCFQPLSMNEREIDLALQKIKIGLNEKHGEKIHSVPDPRHLKSYYAFCRDPLFLKFIRTKLQQEMEDINKKHVEFPDKIGPDIIIDYLIAKIHKQGLAGVDHQDYYGNEHVQLLENVFFSSDSDYIDPKKLSERDKLLIKDQVLQESGLITVASIRGQGINARTIYEFTGHESLKSFFRVQKIIRELKSQGKVDYSKFTSVLEKEGIDEDTLRFWLYFWPNNLHKVQFLTSNLGLLAQEEQPTKLKSRIPLSLTKLEIKPYTTRLLDLAPLDFIELLDQDENTFQAIEAEFKNITHVLLHSESVDVETKYLLAELLAENRNIYNPVPVFQNLIDDKTKTDFNLRNKLVKVVLQHDLLPKEKLKNSLFEVIEKIDRDRVGTALEAASILFDYNMGKSRAVQSLIDLFSSNDVSAYWKLKIAKILFDQELNMNKNEMDKFAGELLKFISIEQLGSEDTDLIWNWKLEAARELLEHGMKRERVVKTLLEYLRTAELPAFWKLETASLLLRSDLKAGEKKYVVNTLSKFIISEKEDPYWSIEAADLLFEFGFEADVTRVVSALLKFISAGNVDPEWRLKASIALLDNSSLEIAEKNRVIDSLVKFISSDRITAEWKLRAASALFRRKLGGEKVEKAVKTFLAAISSEKDPYWRLLSAGLIFKYRLGEEEERKAVNALLDFVVSSSEDPYWRLLLASFLIEHGMGRREESRLRDSLLTFISTGTDDPYFSLQAAFILFKREKKEEETLIVKALVDFISLKDLSPYWKYRTASILLLDRELEKPGKKLIAGALLAFIQEKEEVDPEWRLKTAELLFDLGLGEDIVIRALLDFISSEIEDPYWKFEATRMLFDQGLEEKEEKELTKAFAKFISTKKDPEWVVRSAFLLFKHGLRDEKRVVRAFMSFIESENDGEPAWKLVIADILLNRKLERRERTRITKVLLKKMKKLDLEYQQQIANFLLEKDVELKEKTIQKLARVVSKSA